METSVICAFICMALGYLIGTVNPAYLIARLHGFDIREKGSGNAGASNAVITMGKAVGLVIMLFDIGKAYLAVRLAQRFFPNLTFAAELAGVFTILGHIFPFTMGFRGGKGLASFGGVILAFDVKVFLVMLLGEVVLALVVDYICVMPLTVSAIFPFVYYYIVGQLAGTLLYAMLFPVIVWKHLENLRRIAAGTEAKISYLWSKDEKIRKMREEAKEI